MKVAESETVIQSELDPKMRVHKFKVRFVAYRLETEKDIQELLDVFATNVEILLQTQDKNGFYIVIKKIEKIKQMIEA